MDKGRESPLGFVDMCGRAYETYTDEELYVRYLPKSPAVPLEIASVYNLCPTQNSPVLRLTSGERRFDLMRWQLVPATEPSFSSKLSTFNARSESVFASPLYRDLVTRQRCIVPFSGFYEWRRTGDTKRPFRIFLREEQIMSVAGIWETWHPGLPDERQSFTVLTTSANEFMSEIHDRMPVILARSDEEAWLDPEFSERQTLQKLLKACPSSWLERIEVSSLVNSPKNNSPELLDPVEKSGGATPYTPSLFDT
jgi:putative SOS response-associated peptidase YedK